MRKNSLETLLFIALLMPSFLGAFVPPVAALIRDSLESRKSQPFSELVFRHRIEARPGEFVEVEEQWIGNFQSAALLFKVPGGNILGAAQYDRRNYVFSTGAKVTSVSSLLPKYLLTSSSEDLLGSLLAEKFVKRDHLNQFKPGFEPKGDPQTWEVKEFYIQHEGAALRRVGSEPAYAFTGAGNEDPNHQSVYFRKEAGGIRRFEWKRGAEMAAWNMDGFTRFQTAGIFPKQFQFERNGQVLVTSELLVHRPAKDKQVADLKKWTKTAPGLASPYEEAVKVLLSFR